MADRFDLDAIEADDAFLDLLAAGGESAWQAGEHDPALKLLADLRLAVEVEDELPVETIDDPESFLARCAALNPVSDPFARKLAARGLALGVAAVAALSVSGVAAAVTGNPLSPYEKVIQKIADGLRPETSFPKEELDGLPVVDKTKIVKVGKDFYRKSQQQQQRNNEQPADTTVAGGLTDEPAQSVVGAKPPFLLPPPVVDKTSPIETPVVVQPADPEQPADPKPSEPTEPPTTEPSVPPTTEPTDGPTDNPTDPGTTEPSTPETPPPSETTPSTPPTTPAPGPGDNGSTGNPGENPAENPGDTPVTTVPPVTGGGETSTGTDDETPSGQTGDDTGSQTGDSKPEVPTVELPVADPPVVEVPVAEVPAADLPSGRVGDESGDKGSDESSDPVSEVLKTVVPVLPVEEPVRLEQYIGKGFTGHGKHSSGKPALGYAKAQYAKGKHSTGHYAEGRHAAIARAHGSMAPVTIKQILGVLNTPMSDR